MAGLSAACLVFPYELAEATPEVTLIRIQFLLFSEYIHETTLPLSRVLSHGLFIMPSSNRIAS